MPTIPNTRGNPQATDVAVEAVLSLTGNTSRDDLQTVLSSMDALISKLFEDRNATVTQGGVIGYSSDGTQVTFSEALKLEINSKVAGGAPIVISLGSSNRTISADGRMIYAVVNRLAGTAVVTDDAATLPSVVAPNTEVFLIAKRRDAGDGTKRLYFNKGMALDAGTSGRLDGITSTDGVPTGVYFPFAGTVAPLNYLLCRGQAVSRTTYSSLFLTIGTSHGSGDGSTTFNVPDLRGSIPRGYMDVGSVNFTSGQVNTTFETITVASHGFNRSGIPVRFTTTGTLPSPLVINTTYYVIFVDASTIKVATTEANALAGTAINLGSNGSGTMTVTQWIDPDKNSRLANAPGGASGNNVGAVQADQLASHTHTFQLYGDFSTAPNATNHPSQSVTSDHPGPIFSPNSFGGTETRPRNISTNYIIKT